MSGPDGQTGITLTMHGLSGWLVLLIWFLTLVALVAFAYRFGRWAEEAEQDDRRPALSGEAAEPTTHQHRYERFSRVIEACCDSMHYFCDCGAKEPCATAEPTTTDRGD